MSRVLVFSDLQAHTHKKYATRNDDGVNSRLQVALDVLDCIRELCVSESIYDVFFAGDLFEKKSRVPVSVINAVSEKFYSWNKVGIRTLLIPGNHDHIIRSGESHALSLFECIEGCTVVSSPKIGLYQLSSGESIEVAYLPYRELFPSWWEVLQSRPKDGPLSVRRILLAHGNVEGFCPQPWLPPEGLTKAASFKDWIRKEWLKGYDSAFVGHIHQHGSKVINGCNVVSPGCPYQENASALGEDRGFYVWDTESNASVFVKIDHLPKFKKVFVSELEKVVYPGEVKNNIMLVVPQNNRVCYKKTKRVKDKLQEMGASYVEVKNPEELIQEEGHTREQAKATDGPVEVLKKVIQQGMVSVKGLKESDICKAAQELLSESDAAMVSGSGVVSLLFCQAQDVLCFEEIDIRLHKQGLIGVGGSNFDTAEADSNGCGKSSMVDLICWMLYGKPLRNIRSKDIIRRGQGGCRGLLRFELQGQQYEIFRSKSDREFDSVLHFHKVFSDHDIDTYAPPPVIDPDNPRSSDGCNLRGEDTKQTQQKILNLLGVSFNLFRSLVVSASSGASKFSQLRDSEKKKLLVELLGLDQYEELSSMARVKASGYEQECLSLQGKVEAERPHVESAAARLQEYKEKKAIWEKHQQNTIRLAQEKYDQSVLNLSKAEKNRLPEPEQEFEFIEKENRIRIELEEITKEKQGILLSHHRAESDYVLALEKLQVALKVLQDAKEAQDRGVCPTCGQESDVQIDWDSQIEEATQELEQERKTRPELNRKRLEQLNLKKRSLEACLDDLKASRLLLDSEKEKFRRSQEEFDRAKSEKQWAEERLLKVKGESNHWIDLALQAELDLKVVSESVESNEKKLLQLKEQAMIYSVVASCWGPKGARSLLLDGVVPLLNSRLIHYSKILCDQYLYVQVATTGETASGKTKEEFTLRAYSPEGEVSFGSCSGGEQKRMDIPLLLALQDVAVSHGRGLSFCFLDEVFESLDASGVQGLLDLLNSAVERACGGSIFVVSHNQELLSSFEDSIVFCKKNGISSIALD